MALNLKATNQGRVMIRGRGVVWNGKISAQVQTNIIKVTLSPFPLESSFTWVTRALYLASLYLEQPQSVVPSCNEVSACNVEDQHVMLKASMKCQHVMLKCQHVVLMYQHVMFKCHYVMLKYQHVMLYFHYIIQFKSSCIRQLRRSIYISLYQFY